MSLPYLRRRQTSSSYIGDIVSVLHHREEAASFLVQMRKRIAPTCGRGRLLLDTEERVSLFSIERKQTLSFYRGDSASLLYREEAGFFSIQKRWCLSSLERSVCVPLLYKEERHTPSRSKEDIAMRMCSIEPKKTRSF